RPRPRSAERLQCFEIVGRRLPFSGLDVRAYLLGPCRSRDDRCDSGHCGEPADRDREQWDVSLGGELLQSLGTVPPLRRDLTPCETALCGGLAACVLAREQPAREGEVRQHADAEPRAGGEHVVLDVALDERVLVLRGLEAWQRALARDTVCVLDL